MDGFTLGKRAPTSRIQHLEANRPYPARHPLLARITRSSNEHVIHDGPIHVRNDDDENQRFDSYQVMGQPALRQRPSKSRQERLEATRPYPARRPHLPQDQRQLVANPVPHAEEEERRFQHAIQLLIVVLMLHAIASVFVVMALSRLPS